MFLLIPVNRYSSVLLLIGASVYLMHRISDYCPKMKRIKDKFWRILGFEGNRLEPVFFLNKANNPSIAFNQTKLRTSGCVVDIEDVPDLDLPFPTPSNLNCHQLDINFNYNNMNIFNDKFLSDNHFIRSPNRRPNVTIDRIDEVLTQIDDIKKSIVEIDSQIFDFSGQKCLNFNPEFFTLTNTDLTEDSDDISDDLKTGNESNADEDSDQTPRTPLNEINLEWDLMDVQSDSLYYPTNEMVVESALSLPVTDSDKQKIKSLQELLEEAKQMGLLNNILDAITYTKDIDNKSRDSAYFED